MTSLALTVCAHIAATLYTPRICAFEYRFLPFPNLTPNPPSALPYASQMVEVMEGGMGMAPAGVPYASLVAEVMGRGMGMAPAVVSIASLVVEGMGRGKGMDPAGVPFVSRVVEALGRGDGNGFGGYALGLAAGGGNGGYHALVLSGAEVNPPESLLVL